MLRWAQGIIKFTLVILLASLPAGLVWGTEPAQSIILFIGDGMGPSQVAIAQYYSELVLGKELNMLKLCNEGALGLVTTHAADVLVTDSAAAATALATGTKTKNAVISQAIDGRTLVTITDRAQKLGKKIGIVTNTTICHATPAAFSADDYYRNNYSDIIEEQLLDTQADVYLGGGLGYALPASVKDSRRNDERDLLEEAERVGYAIVQNKAELLDVDATLATKLLGLFARDQMAYEIDRETTDEPSLAEMTGKALEILGRSEQGFFLMVEGGRIDTACHNNDAAAALRETLMFDEAVGVSMEYAQLHRNTLVIWTADHETGGMNMCNYTTPGGAQHNVTRANLERLGKADASFEVVVREFGESKSLVQVQDVIKQHYGVQVTDEEAWLILRRQSVDVFHNQPTNILGKVLAPHLKVVFAAGKHTTTPVMVGAIGPYSQLLQGYHDNTHVGTVMKQAFEGEN